MHNYISFFHGRKDPNQDMNDEWGTEGPVLGPVLISWAYGKIRIHDPYGQDSFEELIISEKGDLILIEDIYYGDFEIWSDTDPLVEKNREIGRPSLDWKRFARLNQEQGEKLKATQ